MTYGSTQGDSRFSGFPFLRFFGFPSSVSPLHPLSHKGEGGTENRRTGETENRRTGETKITLCGTIGHLPLRGRCPTYSEKKNNKN